MTIFIQPALASDSDEVGAIYDYLARLLPYDKGKLKDRFPISERSKHPNVDHWSLSWPIPRDK